MKKSTASLISNIPAERKVVEKKRRDKMKLLYSQLFFLLPDHYKSKETVEISERINETINYIESLKANIKKMKDRKESPGASTSQSHGIQIHEMTPDLDLVLITGLKNHSIFIDVLRVLDQCSTDVIHASFSALGPSTFHVHHKKIEATEIYITLKGLLNGSFRTEELDLHAATCNEDQENLDLWDFEICSDVWFRSS